MNRIRATLIPGVSEPTVAALSQYLANFAKGRHLVSRAGEAVHIHFKNPEDAELLKSEFPWVVESIDQPSCPAG